MVKDITKVCWEHTGLVKLANEFVEDALDSDDKMFLCRVYRLMFPDSEICEDNLSQMLYRYTHLCIGEQKFGSLLEKRGQKTARILASWLDTNGEIDVQRASLRPGIVTSYISHKLTLVDGKTSTFVFALVRWNKVALNAPINSQWWMESDFEHGGPWTFLPVQRIHCRFVAGLKKTNRQMSFVVCPITRKCCF